MGWFLKISILTLLIHVNVAVYLIPEQLMTATGASYTVMLMGDDENIKPKQCYLTLKDNTLAYEIDLTTSGVPLKPINTVLSPSVNENTNFMTSLGYGICGFKLDNVGKNYVSQWNISFVDENKTFYYKFFGVFLRDMKSGNKTKYVPVGDSFSVECWGMSEPFILLNCQLYDPQGTLVLSDDSGCSYRVLTSKMSDYGAWKCVLQLRNNMLPKTIYYNIVKKVVEKVNSNLWQNETNTHVNIGCSINNLDSFSSDINFCEMTRPDGEIFSLQDGFAADRYTALGTIISKAVCGMEIKKPLEEFEKGIWRCEFKYVRANGKRKGSYPIGGFINLSNGTSTLPPAKVPKKILTVVKNSFSISCRVSYSSSYCYMRGPTGTIYPVENNLEPTVGLCKFTKKEATMEDNGLWYCEFAKETGEANELYSFEVVVLEDYNVKPEKKDVENTVGTTAYLKCSTKDLGDYPVQYCRFQNKNGQIFNINPDEKSKNRMGYYGRGLEYGDCGIEIKNVTYSDAGPWTCITRIGNNFDKPEIYSQINLLIR